MPTRAFSDQQGLPQQQQQSSSKEDFFDTLQGFDKPSQGFDNNNLEESLGGGEGRAPGPGRGRGRGRGGIGRGGFGAGAGRGGRPGAPPMAGGNLPGSSWRTQQQIQNQSAVPVEDGTRENGTVKWFDASKGFGFVYRQPANDQVFVHYSAIAGTGFRSLEEGQTVDFIMKPSTRGPVAGDVRVKI